ncbi:hypothetical protein [Priestia megaterium]|uniref:hypothetical protein n=1 Tax=Priestia megaterium TaxID=1404 RepID=UPI000BFDB87B|nr:hypothetical protein [Priestia megaterium]PGO60601.1 hypothetical protein CN981_08615 [Priestia megaterium]
MTLNFLNIVSIFSLAKTAEYERPLTVSEMNMLKIFYDNCSDEQKQILEYEAYTVVQNIKEWK